MTVPSLLFRTIWFALFAVLTSCGGNPTAATVMLDSRLSAAVAITYSAPSIAGWLQAPGRSYVQAWVRFREDLPTDVIFGIDQEFIDGVDAPLYVKNGDWMGLVGLQRTGRVWVKVGAAEDLSGTLSAPNRYALYQLASALQAGTWYRLRAVADFNARKFVSFAVTGAGIDQTLDLGTNFLHYPNEIPMDKRAMSYYVFAMRGKDLAKEFGPPVVYFDDIEAGLVSNLIDLPVFADGFENQSVVPDQPLTYPVIQLGRYAESYWYKERGEALLGIETQAFARGGHRVLACDVSLW